MRAPSRHLRSIIGAGVSLLAVLLPVYRFVSSNPPTSPPRQKAPAPLALDRTRVEALALPAYRGSVPVLSYHEVSERPEAIAPRRFAAQMQLLARERFHTVTVSELAGFLRSGRPLPPRSIVISFDQALGSLWRVADPILEQYDFTATVFTSPATIDHHLPYNLSSPELGKMISSGRWDVEAALAYRPRNRLTAPRLDRLLSSFERLRLPSPLAFLYPRGSAASRAVPPRFPLSFQVGPDQYFVSRSDAPYQQLPLFPVVRGVSPLELMGQLDAARPLAPEVSDALASARGWRFEGGSYADHSSEIRLDSFEPALTKAKHWLAAYYEPTRCREWRDYRTTVEVSSLGEAGSGADATVLIGETPRLTVTVSANRLRVQATRDPQPTTRRLAPAGKHLLQITVADSKALIDVDGKPLLEQAAEVKGGIGLAVWRENERSPTPAFANLVISPPGGR